LPTRTCCMHLHTSVFLQLRKLCEWKKLEEKLKKLEKNTYCL
jgi:hypothetical protein